MPSCQEEWCSLKQVAHQVVTFAAHSLELILPLKIVKKQSDSQVTIDNTDMCDLVKYMLYFQECIIQVMLPHHPD